MYGYEAHEMIGQPLAVITAPEEIEELVETVALLSGGARIEPFDLRRVHENGRFIDVSVTASANLDPDGAPRCR